MQNYINIAFELPVIVMMSVIFVATLIKRDRMKHQRLFSDIVLANIASLVSDAALWSVVGKVGKKTEVKTLLTVDFILSSLLIVLFHYFMLALTREKTHVPRLLDWIVIPLLAVFSIVYLTSFGSGVFFVITDDCRVLEGDLYWVSMIIRLSVLLLDIVITLIYAKYNGVGRTVLLLIYETVPILVSLLDGKFRLTMVFVTASLLILVDYAVLAVEQDKKLAEQEKKLNAERTKIMISQIQPHFLYNVISSIMSFCREDPDKAVDALADFSDYMRTNMRSLSLDAPVMFEKELEHVRTYVRLEKNRFGERLNVRYDIGTTDFFIPSLTLQPIVENAVKHGVGQKEKGGTIVITTRECDGLYEITVRDDGVGFDVAKLAEDEKGDHVGLANVRSRLDMMCGGTMKIDSGVGKGTTVTVFLPKKDSGRE